MAAFACAISRCIWALEVKTAWQSAPSSLVYLKATHWPIDFSIAARAFAVSSSISSMNVCLVAGRGSNTPDGRRGCVGGSTSSPSSPGSISSTWLFRVVGRFGRGELDIGEPGGEGGGEFGGEGGGEFGGEGGGEFGGEGGGEFGGEGGGEFGSSAVRLFCSSTALETSSAHLP